ncbi:clotting factor B-like [Anopheles cruzii]|uniref:clotting factor B-like n=1 Tax=Anopheles cruzii TaxID=68878 RepID=UPI0022EC3792|nr:clotting factor B-like [Anopheles cruzii]
MAIGAPLLAMLLVPVAVAQLDGSFWWMNGNLLKQADALRETKDVKAIVVNKDSPVDEVRIAGNSLAYSNAPDCICVPVGRCRHGQGSANGPAVRDGLCGADNVCCRSNHILALEATSTRTPTTILPSTKLEPIDGFTFDSRPDSQAVSIDQNLHPTEYDPTLLLELSNFLLTHSVGNELEPIETNVLAFDQATTTQGTITTTTTTGSSIISMSSSTDKCGVRRQTVSSQVVFHDDVDAPIESPQVSFASFGEFPWTVAIYQVIKNGSFVYRCGAALLSANILVTAAHCVSDNRMHPGRFVVHAGDWDRRHTRLPHQERAVSKIVVHPNYYSGALFNDVALLFLNEPFNDTLPNVGPICLPNAVVSNHEYTDCMVVGWGGTPKSNDVQHVLQYTMLALIDRSSCEALLRKQPSLGRKFQLHDSFVCALGSRKADSCQGSGGSPFVCNRNGRYYLIGLVSWGIGCGEGVPAVLSNTAGLSNWIRAQ